MSKPLKVVLWLVGEIHGLDEHGEFKGEIIHRENHIGSVVEATSPEDAREKLNELVSKHVQ